MINIIIVTECIFDECITNNDSCNVLFFSYNHNILERFLIVKQI